MEIKSSIECFGTIQNSVSREVAAMYEAHPYPRWLSLIIPAPGSRRDFLKLYFDDNELRFMDRRFNVLIPGCGTGRKAIQLALAYGERANLLATDLSRASLAYAARMASKYGVTNIRFVQMDIFDLPKLDQQFDIVECTGVVHHMADPLEGWRVLLGRTRPGGVMHVSLYSELARREIVRLRKEYEHLITTIDTDYIRRYRHRLMLRSPDTIDALPTRGDFFDLAVARTYFFIQWSIVLQFPKLANALPI